MEKMRAAFEKSETSTCELYRMIAERTGILETYKTTPLFTTDTGDLFAVFREGMSEELRKTWSCSCCRSFLNGIGNLVTLDKKGKQRSFLWSADLEEYPGLDQPLKDAVKRLDEKVSGAKITGIYVAGASLVGRETSGGFHHMYVKFPAGMVSRDVNGLCAKIKQEKLMLGNALRSYTAGDMDRAERLAQGGSLYRFERKQAQFDWLRKQVKAVAGIQNAAQRDRMIWYAAATAPETFCHINSSPLGELLDGISKNYPADVVIRMFNGQMRTYMESGTAPTENQVMNAAEEVERLGLTDALERRYAAFDEIPAEGFLWKPVKAAPAKKAAGIFAGIETREAKAAKAIAADQLPSVVMTFAKFCRVMLKDAAKLEVLTDQPNRFMAMTAPAHEEAKNILRWGGESAGSRLDWYYRGGHIDGEMKRRVESAGGQYENCAIRCSLMWDNEMQWSAIGTDLDLHAFTPAGYHIYYGDKRDSTGGYLDVDANANGRKTSDTPVENIRWGTGNAKSGHYRFAVNNYKQVDPHANDYTVELQVGDQSWRFTGRAGSTGSKRTVFEFDYVNGKAQNLTIDGRSGAEAQAVSAGTLWNVPANNFVQVKGIVASPNMWSENPKPEIGEHAFFLLEGCRDDGEKKTAGFIPETLIPELIPHRRTLQAYTLSTQILGAETADACGMGFSTFGDWNLTLRITMEDGAKRLVKIDRFD